MKQFCSFYIIMFAVFNTINATGQTVTDIDGNVYNTVEIGTQQWMAENLKVTSNEGTAIPLVTDGIGWNNLTTPGYCWYNNDNTTYGDVYGALYNWYGVNAGNFCPVGWHVPTDAEWTVLNDYLGGSSVAGGKLKASILSIPLIPELLMKPDLQHCQEATAEVMVYIVTSAIWECGGVLRVQDFLLMPG